MAIQIKLAGRAAAPRLPALLQGTARSGTQAQDPFLPSGYLQATGTFDVSATARSGDDAATQQAMTAMRAVAGPQGFNIGMNQGSIGGAGIAGHLHQHVVPRWGGDTNFITVVGGTKTMPTLLEETRDLLADAWPE